jgi:uncharacterized protein YkwD
MDSDTHASLVNTTFFTSPNRRALLSLLGVGTLAGGLANLVEPETTSARKKKRRKKKGGTGKGGKGGGGNNKCTGTVNGSASASEEEALLQMINLFRRQNGNLPALARRAQLDAAAVAHSQDMVTRCFFDHVSPGGSDPGDRIAATGYQANSWAENIYKGSGNLGTAAEAFDGWKNSQGHRENMLSTTVTEIGIGAALDGSGWMNWTNVFGRRPPG